MWGAFVTGFAEQASVEIEKTNKEISDRVLAEMSSLIKKKEEAEETAQTKRDAVRKQAAALQALAGPNLTESQIIGIINSGEADTVIKKLRDNTVGPEKIKQLFIPADPNAQADLEQYLSEVGKLTGKAPVRTEMERGAFGLRTRAGEAARARGLAAAGMTEEELYQTRLASPEGVKGRLNLSIFKDEESVSNMQDRLIKTIIDPSSSQEEKNSASKTLGEIGGARALLKAKEEGISFKESDVRANLRNYTNTIKERMAGPGNTRRVLNQETGSVDVIYAQTVKADQIERIESAVDNAINGFINQYYSINGKIPEVVQRVGATFTAKPMSIRNDAGGAGDAGSAGNASDAAGAASATPAVTGTKPSLMQFMIRARKANPKASDEALKAYYEKTYGNK